MIVSAAQVVTPARVLAPGWLLLEGARIVEVGEGPPPRSPDVALGDVTVAPGFVDIHVHGGGGASFDAGTPDAAEVVAAAHLAHGTTSMAASLVTDTTDRMAAAVRELAGLVAAGHLAGIHLEGPWLSPRRSGAHQPGALAHPDPAAVEALLAAGDGAVRMVTLAPELPGGLDAVRRLDAAGVVVAIGHTDATYDQARAALDAGARVGTHLFNAMRALHHREPGAAGALLDSTAAVELIADGVHLHPAVLRAAFAAAPGRCILVTDAMAAAGAPDGDYRLGPMDIEVRDGIARLADSTGDGAIAGSTLTMDAAVRFAVRTADLPLVDVVRAASTVPAAAWGLDDVGALAPGRRADLVVLDAGLGVVRVMRSGAWVRR
ncbi:N-acetylglucosamine-6-phosphate deacetylase [Nocardioides sp. zg-1228]|uniref:N-acetylglucosamine-6-phosphate deacetylase n=1 Tax=Nocardioides sp. zg-1228 TaxID=2763008 RepID=UPI001642C46D|nr:N-acetylglucosamine-6-phosphate deacetylase [Nocardioides sp. zg-1228]MBC2932856.1 N-acetylglucosamine-6-phosphate deacetylase [Nocardioides sp. zg-1228]QSF56930.1 N-acetylglucosamine-6-phosphate deacetylase [Nocardioides sp. zg-1228]